METCRTESSTKRLTYGTRFFADAALVDLPSYLATGLEEHALVSDGLFYWRLGHDIVLPVHRSSLAHTLDHATGYG